MKKYSTTQAYYCDLKGLSEAKRRVIHEEFNKHREYIFEHFKDEKGYTVGYTGFTFGVWSYGDGFASDYKARKLSFVEFVEFLQGYEPPLKVGEHTVQFGKDHIKVGCTEVSHDLLQKIYAKAFGGVK